MIVILIICGTRGSFSSLFFSSRTAKLGIYSSLGAIDSPEVIDFGRYISISTFFFRLFSRRFTSNWLTNASLKLRSRRHDAHVLGLNETTANVAIISLVPSKISSCLLRVTRTMSRVLVEYPRDRLKSLEGKGEIVRFLFCPLQWNGGKRVTE